MKDIYYLTSTGERVDLIGSPYRMLTDTDLFNYEWSPITQGITVESIAKMKKGMVSPQFSIRVIGASKTDLLNKVESLIEKFDSDVYRGEMGRLYVGDYYRKCYIQSASMTKVWERSSTVIQFVAISDNPNWLSENTYTYTGASRNYTGNVANQSVIEANKHSERLIVDFHDDGSIALDYTIRPDDLDSTARLTFVFANSITVQHLGGLTLKNLAPNTTATFTLQGSDDGLSWTDIDSTTVSYGSTTYGYGNGFTAKYIRIVGESSATAGGWNISADEMDITAVIEMQKDNLLVTSELSSLRRVNARNVTSTMFVVDEGTGYIYLDKEINVVTDIDITFTSTPSDQIRLQYFYNGAWVNISTTQTSSGIHWDGNVYVNGNLRIALPQGTTYFNDVSIQGYLKKYLLNESYAPSDMIIKIYGATSQATILIDDSSYGAIVELEETEWLEVNTFNRTVRKYTAEGEFDNVYNERAEGTFDKLQGGESIIQWDGLLTVDITVLNERSQPKWN